MEELNMKVIGILIEKKEMELLYQIREIFIVASLKMTYIVVLEKLNIQMDKNTLDSLKMV
jgi:hypothetical protein